jgi:shikimate kinase
VTLSLVGMPGSGKSTVGRQVAKALHWAFLDADLEIERVLGCSIRSYFETAGEQAFRDVEETVLSELTRRERVVIATGGGAVLRANNRLALKASGNRVFYLRASFDDLLRRLRHDTHRPLLQGVDPAKRLRELFAERDPLYREVSEFVIDTGRSSVAMISQRIAMQMELAERSSEPDSGVSRV